MDMGDTMMMGGADSGSPLNASGIDFSNVTQASTFLEEILDDTEFQVEGNKYARNFWFGICAVIATCALFNLSQKITVRSRMRAAAANRPRPATPSNIFSTSIATVTAIYREVSYPQWTPQSNRFFNIPPLGTIFLLVGYLSWVILLEFVDNNVEGAQHYTSLGIRAAWLAVAQVPLLILLAGKNNLIGLVCCVSYERLNVIHRWVSRVLLFLIILHVIFLHLAWNAYGLRELEYSTDSCITTGYATFAILLWMNISTIAPIRNFSYELFVVQHIVAFFGFIVAVIYHLPSTALYSRVYIYIPIGLYCVDRIIRSARFAWNNARPGHATLTAMEGGVTKVCLKSKGIKNWNPGSHVLLSIPKLGPGQSHPATIASIPSSHGGELVFLLKGHKGFTSRLLSQATNSSTSLLPTRETSRSSDNYVQETHVALIDGPYGNSHNDFGSFDTALLISGSTGTTFTLPILLDIAARAQKAKLPVKRVVFVWIVKNTSWTSWTASELTSASESLRAAGIQLSIKIHVTCDDNWTTGEESESNICGCACDKSLGPCCCVDAEDLDGANDGANGILDEKRAVDGKKDAIVKVKSRSNTSFKSSLTSGKKSPILPCATFQSGRPDFYPLLWELLEQADGETGIAVCGPLGLSSDVRRTVVRCSDERAVHKGTGAQGIYLHSECFGW